MTSSRTHFRVVRARAKINLRLRVLAREASGFHAVETLLQRLALHDVVRVTVRDKTRLLTCDGVAMPRDGLGAPEDNLAWRAANAYVGASGWDTGWDITIDKRIPVGGGLGGGSADAAAVLRAMEDMSPRPVGPAALIALAGTLGADVPFLTTNATLAWGWGRGDRLLALPALPRMAVTLITSDEGVNTAHAYAALATERMRDAAGQPVEAESFSAKAFATWSSVRYLAMNDFEPVVSSFHGGVASTLPRVRAAAQQLTRDGAVAIGMMAGSGATCLVLHPEGTQPTWSDVDPRHLVHTTTSE